jgi:hypothetical protein
MCSLVFVTKSNPSTWTCPWRGAPFAHPTAQDAGYPREIGGIRTSIRDPTMVTSVVRLETAEYRGKPPGPTRFTGCTEHTGSVETEPANVSIFFLVSSLRDYSRISLRYSTQTIVASATRVSASTKLFRVLGLWVGETRHRSARPPKATGGEEEGK